jgi:hypothetical protein
MSSIFKLVVADRTSTYKDIEDEGTNFDIPENCNKLCRHSIQAFGFPRKGDPKASGIPGKLLCSRFEAYVRYLSGREQLNLLERSIEVFGSELMVKVSEADFLVELSPVGMVLLEPVGAPTLLGRLQEHFIAGNAAPPHMEVAMGVRKGVEASFIFPGLFESVASIPDLLSESEEMQRYALPGTCICIICSLSRFWKHDLQMAKCCGHFYSRACNTQLSIYRVSCRLRCNTFGAEQTQPAPGFAATYWRPAPEGRRTGNVNDYHLLYFLKPPFTNDISLVKFFLVTSLHVSAPVVSSRQTGNPQSISRTRWICTEWHNFALVLAQWTFLCVVL